MPAEMRARLDTIPRKPYTTEQLAAEVGYIPEVKVDTSNDLPHDVIGFVNKIVWMNPNPSRMTRPYRTKLR